MFNEDLMKSYNEDTEIVYFLEADVQYPEALHEIHTDLPFSPKRMKRGKTEKLLANLDHKKGAISKKEELFT